MKITSRLRPFLVVWSGQALSLVGSQAVQFALIWWLTATSGSATVLALAAMVGLLPTVVLGPLIGALVDRWNRKRIMILADAAAGLASAALAWQFVVGEPGMTWVFSMLFIRAVAGAFHAPAFEASTTLMVPADQLTRIQGLNQMLLGGLQIVSAPLGALLFAVLPMAAVMAVDVVTALIAILPLLAIHVPQPDAGEDVAGAGGSATLWADMLDGLRFIRRQPGHLSLLLMAAAINLFMVPAFSLLPLLVRRWGGDAMQLGWLSSALGVGTIAGGIALGVWGGFPRRILTTLAALIGVGLATLALGLARGTSWTLPLLAMLVLGIMIAMTNGPIHALLQAIVPPELQGRVFTLYGSLAGLTAPLGLALAAPVAELLSVNAWYIAGGLACIVMSTAGFLTPSILFIEGRTQPCPAET